jgi:hypothetical protein
VGLACAAALIGALPQAPAFAQGCAMCGTAVGDASDPLARSMASSIMFMIPVPFFLFFSVAGWLIYRFRRQARHHHPLSQETLN